MQVIRPGKIGPLPGSSAKARKDNQATAKGATSGRVVWDDFNVGKNVTKKKEYTRGLGDRMVPRDNAKRPDKGAEHSERFEESENEIRYEPRVDFGDVQKAIESFESALSKSDSEKNYSDLGKIEINLGVVNSIKGLFDEALVYFKRALINYQKVNDKKRMAELKENSSNI